MNFAPVSFGLMGKTLLMLKLLLKVLAKIQNDISGYYKNAPFPGNKRYFHPIRYSAKTSSAERLGKNCFSSKAKQILDLRGY